MSNRVHARPWWRLLTESLAAFRFPEVASLLLGSCAISAAVEVLSRRPRRALHA